MKLCSFFADRRPRYGLVIADGIIDLSVRLPETSLRELIAADGLGRAGELAGEAADYAFGAVAHLPVIPDPEKIVCVGLNYRSHIEETGREETVRPVLFPRYAGSQTGHGQALLKPLESEQFDYEGELAVVIGRGGRRIQEQHALEHVAGYACYNDGSLRDWQYHTHQFMPGKIFASTGGFGPWMTTADEIPDPASLHIQTRLNGRVVQDADLSLMINPIQSLIAYCSIMLPLSPGDVIVTGTPGGIGARRTPPLWLRDGDVCEVEIVGVGTLSNPVSAERTSEPATDS